MMFLYFKCVNLFNWSLKDLDDTDFETLIDFVYFEESDDPNTRIIDGKEYHRATAAPSWL